MSYTDRTEYRHKLEDLAREVDRLTERDDVHPEHIDDLLDVLRRLEMLAREV